MLLIINNKYINNLSDIINVCGIFCGIFGQTVKGSNLKINPVKPDTSKVSFFCHFILGFLFSILF